MQKENKNIQRMNYTLGEETFFTVQKNNCGFALRSARFRMHSVPMSNLGKNNRRNTCVKTEKYIIYNICNRDNSNWKYLL